MEKQLATKILQPELALPHPVTRNELLRTKATSKFRLAKDYERVRHGVYIAHGSARPPDAVERGVLNCPRNFRFPHHMITRIRAEALANPNTTFAGWAALRILGLPYWTNDMNVQVITTNSAQRACHARQPDRLVIPPALRRHTTPELARRYRFRRELADLPETVQCVAGTTAVAQALAEIHRGHASWPIPDQRAICELTGLRAGQIRAIQLLDSCLGTIAFDPGGLHRACRGLLPQPHLRTVLARASATADSPPETLLRLAATSVLPDATPQHPLFWRAGPRQGARMTVADLFSQRKRLAIFYDGHHHTSTTQHNYDQKIDRELQLQGLRSLRFNAADMHDLRGVIHTLRRFASPPVNIAA